MGQLIVRNLDDAVVAALKARAAEHGRSTEAEHRAILRAALVEGGSGTAQADWFERAVALRERLRVGTEPNTTDLIRADRDRDDAPNAPDAGGRTT